ncbi:FkbM family methyltransferase [Natrialba sp. INN-245]|uniref:FkbM family methyltransferase n=1 Tax=Natrialba sp. INN-245 TaxID=2690967 RepID=UPI00130FE029|nr:FkbM family methyltransferase [Natrialba sp. INN-245]MWV40416.1 FkbM family methyltransferase [Natrialba sp. INN-245]
MSTVVGKLFEAISRPDKVLPYLRTLARVYWSIFRSRDLTQLCDTTGGLIFGQRYLEWRYGDSVIKEVEGSLMKLDTDEVIGQELIIYGVREPITTSAYKRELERLKRTCDGEITILEVGANIGYYALLAASVLGERASVYAVEPDPDNYERFLENVELNGYEEMFETSQVALGTENGTGTLRLSSNCNNHILVDNPDNSENTRQVETVTPSSYFDSQEIDLQSVNVIRMDIDGFECELIPLLEETLAQCNPIILHIEIHPKEEEAFERLLRTLEKLDFKICSAGRNHKNLQVEYKNISRNVYTELIMVRE